MVISLQIPTNKGFLSLLRWCNILSIHSSKKRNQTSKAEEPPTFRPRNLNHPNPSRWCLGPRATPAAEPRFRVRCSVFGRAERVGPKGNTVDGYKPRVVRLPPVLGLRISQPLDKKTGEANKIHFAGIGVFLHQLVQVGLRPSQVVRAKCPQYLRNPEDCKNKHVLGRGTNVCIGLQPPF